MDSKTGRIYPVAFEGTARPSFGIDPAALKVKTIPLDSALENHRVEMTGTFIYAIKASSKTVTLDLGFQDTFSDKMPFYEGQFIGGVRFDHVYVDCSAQSGGYITFIYGVEAEGQMRFNNPSSQFNSVSVVRPATITTTADATLVADTTTLIAAADSTRHEVLIHNLSANTLTLRIGESAAAAARGIPLAPGQTMNLTVSGAVYAYNPAGATTDVCILEIKD